MNNMAVNDELLVTGGVEDVHYREGIENIQILTLLGPARILIDMLDIY